MIDPLEFYVFCKNEFDKGTIYADPVGICTNDFVDHLNQFIKTNYNKSMDTDKNLSDEAA